MTEAGGTPQDAASFKKPEGFKPSDITLSKEIDLSGQVAVVTGASKGVGRAIAIKLAYHGAGVVFNSRLSSASEAQEVLNSIAEMGGQAAYVLGDIQHDAVRKQLVETAIKQFGGLDILVNNAGITNDNVGVRMTEEQWDSVVDINMKSAFFMSQEALKYMGRRRSGRILNISSRSAQVGTPAQANYAGAKAGAEASHLSLAQEYASRGIQINSLELALVEEPTDLTGGLTEAQRESFLKITPTGKGVGIEEVADFATYIVSGRLPSFTRQIIKLDGGMLS